MNIQNKPEPESIRMGTPYDSPAFEALCREMSIWGTAQAALCAVFWRKAEAAMAESIGAGGVSELMPVHVALHCASPVGDAGMPVIAYLRATPDGKPIWAEDCVCEEALWPMEDDLGAESPDVSLAMIKQADAQAALSAKDAEIAALLKAATRVLCDTEAGHRPPLRDRLETGLMARVRIAALADLHDAVISINPAFNQPVTQSAWLTKALTQVFGWEKP